METKEKKKRKWTKKRKAWNKEYRIRNAKRIRAVKKIFRNTVAGRLTSYKSDAKYRGIKFKLTLEDFQRHWQMDCFYCGGKIETIGLDRIDNKIGYIPDNIVPCCGTFCNNAKKDLSPELFIEMCVIIANRFTSI